LLYLIFFLTFLGFYAILLLAINAGMSGFTREITIPVRAILGITLLGLLVVNWNEIKVRKETKLFILFAFLYFLRVVIDYYLLETYYISVSEVFIYFISFAVIPFISLSTFR